MNTENLRLWYEKDEQGQRTGKTIAVIREGNIAFVGISKCNNDCDQFNKKIGRTIAIGRAKHIKDVVNNKKKPRVAELYYDLNVGASIDEIKKFYLIEFKHGFAFNIYDSDINLPEWLYKDVKKIKSNKGTEK